MSNNLVFITSINAAKLRLLSELEDGNEKTFIFDARLRDTRRGGSVPSLIVPRPASKKYIMTLKEAQTAVDEWIKTYGVRYFSELTNMALLTEEVGELARIIARTYGDQSFKESDKNRNMADEMADILWVLLCLANQTGVDLTEAFAKNMEKKTSRDKERHIHNDKLRDPIA